jgi:hypothetical protein
LQLVNGLSLANRFAGSIEDEPVGNWVVVNAGHHQDPSLRNVSVAAPGDEAPGMEFVYKWDPGGCNLGHLA